MNYWLITTEFPPIHGGGISTYCWHTSKMLADAGHIVTVFINDYTLSKTTTIKIADNINLIRFKPSQVKIGKALGYDARLSLEFANIIEKQIEIDGVPDILETQDYLGIGYYILQKKYLLYPNFKDLKVVLTMHAPNFLYLDYNQVPLYNFPEYWTGEMEKASIRMADLVISPSNYLIDQLKSRMDLTDKNPVRIFNPYANENPSDEISNYEEGDIVFFGKLTPQKGCLELLAYLKRMWDNGFNKTLSIIGGGNHFFYPVQEDMIVHIKKIYATYIAKGLIQFEGNLTPNILVERLKKAHVIITPSTVDNLPYAVLEAMAMGKMVLASDKGGHTEVITPGVSGFIFSHKTPKSFENELLSILKLSSTDIARIGKKAKESIQEKTNYETILKQKTTLLTNLIAQDKPLTQFPFINSFKAKSLKHTKSVHFDKGKLSIVIPYYNMGKYILDTVESLMKISYNNTEIILINDGSTDSESISILSKIEEQYPVKIIHKKNEGLSLTRNFGADQATGEFLAFLDADDTISPDFYTKAIPVLNQYNNVSFVGCWAQYFGESNAIWPTFNPEFPYLLTHNMINSSALIYKTKDFLVYGKNDAQMIYGMEDYESVINMVKNEARGIVFPEIWWQYRIRKDSMQQAFTKDKELYLYRKISKKHPELFQKYGVDVANLLNHNGTGTAFINPTKSLNINFNERIIFFIKKNNTMRNIAKKLFKILKK
jgi:glycosyltransferase involved in cell wall biosynthesis